MSQGELHCHVPVFTDYCILLCNVTYKRFCSFIRADYVYVSLNWQWEYVLALHKILTTIGLFLQPRMLTLTTAKPKSLSRFSSLPLVHSFAPHTSAGLEEWLWGSGVKGGGVDGEPRWPSGLRRWFVNATHRGTGFRVWPAHVGMT